MTFLLLGHLKYFCLLKYFLSFFFFQRKIQKFNTSSSSKIFFFIRLNFSIDGFQSRHLSNYRSDYLILLTGED